MAARIIQPVLLALAVVATALAACSADDGTIPPCTPVEGSDVDTCERDISKVSTTRASGGGPGPGPPPIRWYLDGGRGPLLEGHIVVRGTYKPSTVRCVDQKHTRHPTYITLDSWEVSTGIGILKCYADIQVNAYIVGSGPSTLTAMVIRVQYWDRYVTARQIETLRADGDSVLLQGGYHPRIRGVPDGGITGVESILFLGPELDASVEGWQVFATWDVERRKDGTVIAVHPHRDGWAAQDDYETAYRSKVEMTLPDFKKAAQAAHTSRLAEYGGRIDKDIDYPKLVTDATKLHAFYVETGAVTHPDGPPSQDLPPPCGLAVPSQTTNPGLMLDCFALLAARDTLRGTGTLNWSVDIAIAEWDGVTVAGTPQRVARLELAGRGLTGCIPPALRDAVENDLDALGLPDCVE